MTKLKKLMLLDDNAASNYIHNRILKLYDCADEIVIYQSGYNALEYLKKEESNQPEIIFIDINMPIMDAWEFLESYYQLHLKTDKKPIVILLTTSLSPKDIEKAKAVKFVNDIHLKPLSSEVITVILEKHFS